MLSANDISGLPIFEVDADSDKVTMGSYGNNTFTVSGLLAGFQTANPTEALHLADGYALLPNGTRINEFSTDGTLGDDSDDAVPTEKAVKTAIDAATLAGTSGTSGSSGSSGSSGTSGSSGNTGNAAGHVQYNFDSSTTVADPGSGDLRLNNGTQNAATVIICSDEDILAVDVQGLLATFDDSTSAVKGHIVLSETYVPEN